MFGEAGFEPEHWIPAPVIYTNYYFSISGNVSTGANKFIFQPHRPGIVKDVQLIAGTAPVGAALIVDVNTWDGAAFTTMFSTKPTIADGANRGGAQPDSTYERRCLSIGYDSITDEIEGSAISIDVDQIGSGTAGANLGIMVRVLHTASIWESVMDFDHIGI
jgi:hypothetical protein